MDNQIQNVPAAQKASPKDVFLQLLSIITFYASVISFLVLVFQYINLGFPDKLETIYSRDSAMSSLRWALSMLIVLFPSYVGLSWYLNKSYEKNPEKRSIRIRKWLTYLTLSLAGITVAVDLITLIFNFLQGDLTTRFILKIVAVLFVAVSSFAYYLWDIRRHE